MPLYAIRRNVGLMQPDEVDAAAFRAIVCAYEFPGLKWERSYWDAAQGEINCYYHAVDEAQIREHARKSSIPCDSVALVTELTPDLYWAIRPEEPQPQPVAR